MSRHKENVSAELNEVIVAAGHGGPCQRHLLYEDGEPVAGGGKVELEVTFEGLGEGVEKAGVEGEDRDHLLLHIQPRLAPVGGADLVQSENTGVNGPILLIEIQ